MLVPVDVAAVLQYRREHGQMEKHIKAKQILYRGWSACRDSYHKLACITGVQVIFLLTVSVLLISCTTIKKAGVTATAAAAGATAATVLSGGAAAPILGATTGAFVGDVATEVMMSDKSKVMNMDNCAPDNFWTLLGDLASMGGWLLILVIIIPMVLGWFLPGPVKLKGRDKPQYIPSGYK